MTGLTRPHLDALHALTQDRDAPPGAAAAASDALAVHAAADDLRTRLRTDKCSTDAAYREAIHAHPRHLVDALRASTTSTSDLDRLRVDLDVLRARSAAIADDLFAVDRALAINALQATTALRQHLAVLVPYIATKRATARPFADVEPHIDYIWSTIGGRVRVVYPYEACEADDGTMLPHTERLTLGPNPRHRWAWACVCVGQVEVDNRDYLTRYRIAAEWDDRHALIASLTPGEAPTIAEVVKRALPIGRGKRAS